MSWSSRCGLELSGRSRRARSIDLLVGRPWSSASPDLRDHSTATVGQPNGCFEGTGAIAGPDISFQLTSRSLYVSLRIGQIVHMHPAYLNGRVQRQIRRAFLAHPDRELSTSELILFWCFPRLAGKGAIRNDHIRSTTRAAQRVAVRVRRDRPGGVVWRARK